MAKLSADEQYELITRNLEEVVGEDDIKKTLQGIGVFSLFLVAFSRVHSCSFSLFSFNFYLQCDEFWHQTLQFLAWKVL